MSQPDDPRTLETTAGDFPLVEYRLRAGGREWTALHTGSLLTHEQELGFLREKAARQPYGVILWPSAIALAHEVASRGEEWRGRSVLELGAGTGLPGIVASALGARVVQTDRHEVALMVCKRNGERNGAGEIVYRVADWVAWDDQGRYDLILGSDILYGDVHHPPLRRIFEANLAHGGRVLLADPFRAVSLRLLESLEADGWGVSLTRYDVGQEGTPRPIGVFDLTPPAV